MFQIIKISEKKTFGENIMEIEKKEFACTLCEKTFTSRHGLQFHRRKHEIVCEKCWCKFDSRDELAKVPPLKNY